MTPIPGQAKIDFRAKARRRDPVQSHFAADKINRSGKVFKEWIATLKALNIHGISTAKHLDNIMPTANSNWDGWAHKRMKELDDMGLVIRQRKDWEGKNMPMMLCQITDEGKELLKWQKQQRG